VRDWADFVLLVVRMREAQKGYFAARTRENLRRAKALERQVDRVALELQHGVRQEGLWKR